MSHPNIVQAHELLDQAAFLLSQGRTAEADTLRDCAGEILFGPGHKLTDEEIAHLPYVANGNVAP